MSVIAGITGVANGTGQTLLRSDNDAIAGSIAFHTVIEVAGTGQGVGPANPLPIVDANLELAMATSNGLLAAIGQQQATAGLQAASNVILAGLAQRLAQITITQTIVALPAGDATQLIGANPNRRYLALIALAGGDVTLGFPTPPAVGQGWPLPAPVASAVCGEPVVWDGTGPVPGQAIGGISGEAATVIVLEGI